MRRAALATRATFEELTFAFQSALGPGLAEGLNVDQVVKFSTAVAQAAGAIGLEQRQLAEEVRSILTGTVNPRNTRVAQALNITNAEIRQAREAGRLFEFLEERFEVFGAASEEAGQTFNQAIANIRDAFQTLTGEATLGLFDQLREGLVSFRDALVDIQRSASGQVLDVQFNSGIVDSLRQVIDPLTDFVSQLRENIGVERVLAAASNFLRSIGSFNEAVLSRLFPIIDRLVQRLEQSAFDFEFCLRGRVRRHWQNCQRLPEELQ